MDPESLQKQHTEQSILQTYLLIPSPLSTIIPFQTFTTLSSTSSNTTRASSTSTKSSTHLKPIYRSLQNLRNLIIAEVNDNITRECRKSQTLEARLSRSIAAEQSETSKTKIVTRQTKPTASSESIRSVQPSSKRKQPDQIDDEDNVNDVESQKRPRNSSEIEERAEDEDAQSQSNSRPQSNANPESSVPSYSFIQASNDPSKTKPSDFTATEVQIDTTIHGPHGLVPPSTSKTYHTTRSLLSAMGQSIRDLESEISELDDSTATALTDIQETIGALSDLRYGRFAGSKRKGGDEDGEGDEENGKEMSVEEKVVRELRELERVCGLI